MNRTKLKKASAGQRNISLFFCVQSHKKDLSSSTKLSISDGALTTSKTQIKDGETATFAPHSPLKRTVLGDLENLLPSSPDLLCVPETPNSQIKVASPSSSRDPGQPSPQPSRVVADVKELVQLSPICRSPKSKEPCALRVMSDGGGKTKREEGCSGSIKRLISPPQESNNAKRQRPANTLTGSPTSSNLEVTRPLLGTLKTPHVSNEGSQGYNEDNEVVLSDNKSKIYLKSVCKGDAQDETEKDSGFALIRDKKVTDSNASQNPLTHLEEVTHNLTAHTHMPATQTVTPAMQGRKEGELDEMGAARTGMTSANTERDNGTSSDQGRAGGTAAACPVEERLDESWFAEQMDDGDLVTEDKPKTTRKVPDHVILTGGRNNRYWVLDVEERPDNKTLTISCFRSLQPTETCVLKDGWEMTPVRRGDVVHLEGHSEGGSWVVDREQGFLVLLPDSLVSGTTISNSIRCMRRAVLGDMFKSFDGGSKQMLNGTIVHEVFQRAATTKDFSLKTLTDLADQALCSPQYLGDMYTLGVTQEEMKRELQDYLPSMEKWAKEYLSSPSPKAVRLKMCQDSETLAMVTELADIEENVWSPRFGLKGKIDVTARVRMQRPRNGSRRTQEERTIPLELKTGRETNSIEHRSQVILYTLMCLERYNPEAGLLLYLKTGNLHPVVASHMDRRGTVHLHA